jgi:bacteriorhodopsin
MQSVKITTDLSIFIQIITGIASFQGIFITLPEKHKILNEVLALESFVQVVELFFYAFFLKSVALKDLPQMAGIRYFDWVITTPTMLLTTIAYFKYEEHLEKGSGKILHFGSFLEENKENVIHIVLANFLMLLFGYLGEIGVIDSTISIVLGFLFFAYAFYIIYKEYAVKAKKSLPIFYFIFSIWSLYGIAAIFNPHHKNNMYNILDIFAKNFFGLYLYYKAYSVNK